MRFRSEQKVHSKYRWARLVLAFFLTLLLALAVGAVILYRTYQANLDPLSSNKTTITVTIDSGATNAQIAGLLESKKIIRSDWAFEWYVRTHPVRGGLQAGTYGLSADKSVPEIIMIISGGAVAAEKPVTILPGKRLDQIRAGLIEKAGFSPQQVDAALEPSQYQDHPALAGKPPGASLEGYLYPETFHRTSDTTAKDIIKLSLDEMNSHLTPELRESFAKQGLSPHQAVIIASVVEQEVSNSADRPVVAQVFLKRYRQNMQLGSDVTAFYGSIINDQEPSVAYDSPYNTRLHNGLPPGPISNVSKSSLQAVATPAATDWLFFVAGDDGKTYFSNTVQEHEALTRQHCTKLCQ